LLVLALRHFGAVWSVARYPASPGRRTGEATLALILCAAIVITGYAFDAAFARWAMTLPEPVTAFFAKVTLLGTSGYIFALCVVVAIVAVLAAARARDPLVKARMNGLAARAMFVFMVNAVGGIASQALKHLAGRARPKLMDMVGPFHFDLFSIRASLASFPSGHTVTVFATATALGYFVPRLRVPLYLVATLVAISRLAIGAHYPSDVLAGVVFGIGTAIYMRRGFARRAIAFRPCGTGFCARPAASPVMAFALLFGRGDR
jgi:undecaprenyl-diphosphatase